MKRILTLVVCVFALSYSASSQVKFGPQATLFFDGTVFGVGAKAHKAFSDDIEGQASFTYFLESGTFWAIDVDVLYNGFDIGDVESFKITPFAGLNYFNSPGITILGVSAGGSSVGLNLGVSAKKAISDGLELFIEPKIILGGGSTFALSGGVFF